MTFDDWWAAYCQEPWKWEGKEPSDFARAAWEAAALAEREACAKMVETAGAYTEWNEEAVDLARQIRERPVNGVHEGLTRKTHGGMISPSWSTDPCVLG